MTRPLRFTFTVSTLWRSSVATSSRLGFARTAICAFSMASLAPWVLHPTVNAIKTKHVSL
jgi:hypothetical protein